MCLQQRHQLCGAGEEIVSKSSNHNTAACLKASSEKIISEKLFRISFGNSYGLFLALGQSCKLTRETPSFPKYRTLTPLWTNFSPSRLLMMLELKSTMFWICRKACSTVCKAKSTRPVSCAPNDAMMHFQCTIGRVFCNKPRQASSDAEQRVHGRAFGLEGAEHRSLNASQAFGRGLLMQLRKSLFPHG